MKKNIPIVNTSFTLDSNGQKILFEPYGTQEYAYRVYVVTKRWFGFGRVKKHFIGYVVNGEFCDTDRGSVSYKSKKYYSDYKEFDWVFWYLMYMELMVDESYYGMYPEDYDPVEYGAFLIGKYEEFEFVEEKEESEVSDSDSASSMNSGIPIVEGVENGSEDLPVATPVETPLLEDEAPVIADVGDSDTTVDSDGDGDSFGSPDSSESSESINTDSGTDY